MLGTTLKQAGSQKKQWRIDYDYQYEVAIDALKNGVQTLELMSSVGASPRTRQPAFGSSRPEECLNFVKNKP